MKKIRSLKQVLEVSNMGEPFKFCEVLPTFDGFTMYLIVIVKFNCVTIPFMIMAHGQ